MLRSRVSSGVLRGSVLSAFSLLSQEKENMQFNSPNVLSGNYTQCSVLREDRIRSPAIQRGMLERRRHLKSEDLDISLLCYLPPTLP